MEITKELVVEKIREWEMDAGESFFDNGLIQINPLTLMTWCLGRKYITVEQFNDWNKDWAKNKLEAIDENYYIYNDSGEYGVSYAIIVTDDYKEEAYRKALLIFGEFVSEIDVYKERFKKFLEEEF